MASKCWFRTSLTGGDIGALDAIDGNLISESDGAIVITEYYYYVYYCDIDSSVEESAPDYILPDENSNGKYWKLVPLMEPSS